MQSPLYLDTARMGQMSPLACAASIDFARFANEQGCTLYFCEFLKDGFDSLPSQLKERFAGLRHWQGVESFKHDLRQLSGSSVSSDVLLSGRSATLMKFAAKLFSGPCRNVLITDTCWPAYRNILKRESNTCEFRISQVAVRQKLFRDSLPSRNLVEHLAEEFMFNKCDGIFLPLVDNLGVRLPIERIVRCIRKQCELRFVVVDGAQAIGHVPLNLHHDYCDLLIAGSHKWLRAFHSMGIGFYGNAGSRQYIADSLDRWTASGELDDPLLAFVDELTTGKQQLFGETVQVAPLISASAAAVDALANGQSETTGLVDSIVAAAESTDWRLVSAQDDMSSGIILLEPARMLPSWAPDAARRTLLKANIAATAYPGGMLRLSLPHDGLSATEEYQLRQGLSRLTRDLSC